MDWSYLRRLDLAHGAPRHLLAALTGNVPRLKALAMGLFHQEDYAHITWACPDLTVVQRFLAEIDGLEEIMICC